MDRTEMKNPLKLQGLTVFILAATLTGCADDAGMNDSAELPASNPLLENWDTPFGTPPFDRIESEHYLPALRAGMLEQKKEIDAITANPAEPTFANTIEAYEASGGTYGKVSRVFSAVNGAHSDDVTKATARIIAPEFASHRDDILLNAALFDRINKVYDQRGDLILDAEQMRLLDETHKRFVRAGINLDAVPQSRVREINAGLATLTTQFRENLLNDSNEFELLVTDRGDLGDLPLSLVALAAEEATNRGRDCECWIFTLQRPSINPFLQYSPNRELRKKIYVAYAMRGDNDNQFDNKEIVTQIVALRAERATIIGFRSHADYVLTERMAERPGLVYELLDQVWTPALRVAKAERSALQEMMNAEGVEGNLEGWDWRYYTEKVRKAEYDLDEEALRPYFEVDAVRDGAFALANHLFGLQFERLPDIAGWHPDQQVFEVKEADGRHLAVLYMDFFARKSKRSGAWKNALRQQSKLGGDVTPIITNNFNFPAPTDESPSLLSLGEASTVFHEFGHALHGMMSDVTYETFAGASTPRDFVEFPSQVMQNWIGEPEVLRTFARHYETGEPIPEEIIDRIVASRKFNQGFVTVEYMAASYLDMAYHTTDSTEAIEPRSFEIAAMADIGLIEEILPRYRSTNFAHIFAGGYSAGYYGYLWSQVLDADAFQAFKETGLFDAETAARLRAEILSKGYTRPGMELYINCRGRPPLIEPLLERRGLN
jgi:peptidyl-dipeptidase Dcp